jgi:hypothetical protein
MLVPIGREAALTRAMSAFDSQKAALARWMRAFLGRQDTRTRDLIPIISWTDAVSHERAALIAQEDGRARPMAKVACEMRRFFSPDIGHFRKIDIGTRPKSRSRVLS